MNHLAHALLAGPSPGLVLGGLMGDFVKGRIGDEWSAEVRAGLLLHRRIDTFTDAHPLPQRSRRRIGPRRRRFAGIIVDMCYDHFLAREWSRFSTRALPAFCLDLYATLEDAAAQLPPRLARIAPRMAAEDWLGSYANLAALGQALDGIASRRASIAPLAGAAEDIAADYEGFRSDFLAFFPLLMRFCEDERRRIGESQIEPSRRAGGHPGQGSRDHALRK